MSTYISPAVAGLSAPADESQHAEPANLEKLTIVVRDEQQGEIEFSVSETARFKKIKDRWCKIRGIDILAVRFSFDGRRINDNDTLEELEIEDGDIVDVHLQQSGGSAFRAKLDIACSTYNTQTEE